MIPVRQVWPEEYVHRYREAGYWTGETFGSFLRDRAEATPDRYAVVGGEERWSYAELDRRADALAAGFLAHGFAPGDRVILQLPNIPVFLSVIFGLYRAGILPVFALPAHRKSEIVHFARAAEATGYIIVDRNGGFDYRTLAAEVVEELPGLRIIVAGDSGTWIPLAEVEKGGPDALPVISPSDAAFLQLSGGSTGLSKLIPRTHDDYLYSVRESARICGLDSESVYMGTLPIAHNFPMSSPGVLGTLHAGGTVVLSPAPTPDVAFPIIEREKVTITAVVPPLALVWLEAAPKSKWDLSSLRVLQVGGARLAPEVAARVQPAIGASLQQVFGMAEGLVNYTRLDDPEEVRINTQGRPISPDDEILIVDEENKPVPDGTPGQLLTRGPYTIRAYHNADSANLRAFTTDGYYRTGDLVSRRADGNLVVHGRTTDIVNRGGEKVPVEEVEDHLLAHPSVLDAVVIGLPDSYLGEKSCAVIIPRDSSLKPPAIRSWIRGRGLAAYKVPDRVVFLDAFPETGVGKISRRDLRSALRARIEEKGERE